ncbi:hypothetical protein A3Q56_08351 [Intoshia linei]|uniref:IFT121 second beta-propeller domain-containing protein n=1 Tax=Intoshia linei TaxID=1819745 RepID=A0A177APK1_9BILA|nr:hypothetical protein A3Q56_08351 [Intoshia linei]
MSIVQIGGIYEPQNSLNQSSMSIDVNEMKNQTKSPLLFERKDIWSFMWAKDKINMFCVLEKFKLNVYDEFSNIQSFPCSFVEIVSFTDLTIKVTNFDNENVYTKHWMDSIVEYNLSNDILLNLDGTELNKENVSFEKEKTNKMWWYSFISILLNSHFHPISSNFNKF